MTAKRIAQILLALLLAALPALAQESDPAGNWDNLLFVGTRAAYAKSDWRFSGEFPSRFKDDWGALDNWFVEGVATYLPSKNWEVVPDLRITRKPSTVEFRPGMGVLFKILSPKLQVVNQFKYQANISTNGKIKQSVRQVIFLNKILSKKLIPTLVGGYFYTWKENFSAIEYIRFGGGVTVTFDEVHAMTFIYYAGFQREILTLAMTRRILQQRNSRETEPYCDIYGSSPYKFRQTKSIISREMRYGYI